MEVLVLGLNHKTAPLEIREKLSVPSHRTPEVLDRFRQMNIFQERLILSTCNRTEIYGVGKIGAGDIERAKNFLSEYSRLELKQFEDKLYVLNQPRSVKHLFSVASGLDSMVIGETEIIGQVKDAYRLAHEHGQTGKVLNTLFQRSLKVAKDLRSGTEIGAGRVSIASVAVDLATKILGALTKARVYVIGTGEMATQVTKALASKGAVPVIVSSHHPDRADFLANQWGGEAIQFQEYESKIKEADILIASTGCTEGYLITSSQVQHWMKTRHEKPLFLIDIAVPRNIDPYANKLDNVYLYNIDDLQGIADKNKSLRENQIDRCQYMVEGQTRRYMEWLVKEYGMTADHG